jgi:hypothetical protein
LSFEFDKLKFSEYSGKMTKKRAINFALAKFFLRPILSTVYPAYDGPCWVDSRIGFNDGFYRREENSLVRTAN